MEQRLDEVAGLRAAVAALALGPRPGDRRAFSLGAQLHQLAVEQRVRLPSSAVAAADWVARRNLVDKHAP